MDEEIFKKIEEQGIKIDQMYNSLEKIRKYFKWTLIITGVVVVLPLIGMLFAIPQFLDIYTGAGLDY